MRNIAAIFACLAILPCAGCGETKKTATPSKIVEKVNSVSVSPSEATISFGGSAELKVTVSVTGAATKAVTCSVSDGICTAKSGSADTFIYTPIKVAGLHTATFTSMVDGSKSATAKITVEGEFKNAGLSWLKSYAPPGGTAEARTDPVIAKNGDIVLAADVLTQGASEPVAALVKYDKDGNQLDIWINLEPSTIMDLAYDASADKIYVTGRLGSQSEPSKQKALFLIVSASSFTVTNHSFQVEGRQSEGRGIAVNKSGMVGLALNSSHELCWQSISGSFCSNDFIGIYDTQGNTLHEWVASQWQAGSDCRGSVSSIAVDRSPDSLFPNYSFIFSGKVVCGGTAVDNYMGEVFADGEGEKYSITTYSDLGQQGRHSKVGKSSLGMWFATSRQNGSKQNMTFAEYAVTAYNPPFRLINGPVEWDGDNQGTVSWNTMKSAVFTGESFAGGILVGSLSRIGEGDPDRSDGGIVYIAKDVIYGDGLIIEWEKRFSDLPNGFKIESLDGIAIDPDGYIIIVGTGVDKALVGKSLKKGF